ncbi:hypothetical protein [Streptomyces fulvoviolaceus]|uniref:hypothetical protein n=1 Tax=Streptomyces fulvoviolaceus TaxID=285535 RepID=UPI000ADDB64E|nr:hypothetical protein [Streptomyces fulvoviolaceus]MCT9081440.1 hypothetical protein [Streptomyces fulvoviolaceus]
MLASVATEWLWLMAATATVVHCGAMARWIPVQRFWRAYPFIWVLCLAGMIAVGRSAGFSLAAMLVMYAFSLIGLTIGMFPSRKLFTRWSAEINAGETPEDYDYPRSHLTFCVVVVVVMLFAAFALTR